MLTTFLLSSYSNHGFTKSSNLEDGINPSTNTSSYATLYSLSGASIDYNFDTSSLQLFSTITLLSVSCNFRCWCSASNVSCTVELRCGNQTLNSTTILGDPGGISNISDNHELSNFDTFQNFYLNLSSGVSGKSPLFYFGGADLTLEYLLPDSTIKLVKIYKKISGVWEPQENYSELFSSLEYSEES